MRKKNERPRKKVIVEGVAHALSYSVESISACHSVSDELFGPNLF
jgi:hypothetical protein